MAGTYLYLRERDGGLRRGLDVDGVPVPADRGVAAEVALRQDEVAGISAVAAVLAEEKSVCVAVHVQQLEDVVVAVADGTGDEDLTNVQERERDGRL